MLNFLATLLATLPSILRSRAALELENLALRHQIGVLQRSARKRAMLTPLDRLLWACLSRIWSDWRWALTIVQPETVVAWASQGIWSVLGLDDSAGPAGKTHAPPRSAVCASVASATVSEFTVIPAPKLAVLVAF